MKQLKRIVAVAAFFSLSSVPAFADFEAARQACAKGEYDVAVRELKPAAENGEAQAQSLFC